MIELVRDWWNDHVPSWFQERCTERFVGHVLLLVFVVVAAVLVSWFSVQVSLVLRQALLGGFLFAVARFVFHERSTVIIASMAVIGVGVNDVFLPWLTGSGSVHLLSRLPLLSGMIVLESLEEEGLEEEVEAVEER
jgi:hypothetical protein